ncbi:patched domain-containing protein 3-like [Glandiceps talaboti]
MACNFQFDCIEKRLALLFYRHGRFIGQHPLPFLIIPVLVALGLACGMVFFTQNTNVEYLFTPEDSQAMQDRVRVEELFSFDDNDRFQGLRQTTLGLYGRLILTSTDGGDVMRENILIEILKLHDHVMDINTTENNNIYQYEDLCGKWKGDCNQNAILQVLNFDATTIDAINFTYPIHSVNPTVQVFIGSGLGGVDLHDDGETIKSTEAMQLFYFLRHSSVEEDKRSKAWEIEFLNKMAEYKSDDVKIAYFTSQTQELELAESSLSVIPRFSITFSVLITFSIVCCVMADWVRSKPWLGQLGVLSAGLAVISSLGLCSYCGLPFINVVASMPFLILGIGVDDMFIMIAAWRQTPPNDPVEERMGKAFKEAAASITITSITDFLAFCIGAITFFPSVRIFCFYTGIAVLFDYAYQITFFGACMTLMGRREAANRHCMTCMKVRPKEEVGDSPAYRLFCAGGSSEKTPPKVEDNEHFCTKVFQRLYGPFIVTLPVKIITVLAFVVYLTVAIWGCLQLQEGIRLKNLANDDSYAVQFYNLEDEYFKVYGPAVTIAINDEVDYSDTSVQNEIENVIRDIEESDYFHDNKAVTQSWLRDFLRFMNVTGLTYTDYSTFVLNLRNSFLTLPLPYEIDINFSEDNTSITSSRFYVFSKDMSTANREREMMIEVRHIIEKSDIKLIAFHPAFVFYEQYIAVLPNTLQNIGIAAAAMFVVSLVLIPHPICSIYVTVAIATISTGVVGYMTLWNVRLDSISMINIIICIGFSVDFSAHITYAFVIAPHESRDKRAIEALHLLGWPILQGALSTILGVAALATSDSYVFRTFFKTMFLVILIGAFHGLLFLPVFLTLIGPCKPTRKTENGAKKNHEREMESYINPALVINEKGKLGDINEMGLEKVKLGDIEPTTSVSTSNPGTSENETRLPGTVTPTEEKMVLKSPTNEEERMEKLGNIEEDTDSIIEKKVASTNERADIGLSTSDEISAPGDITAEPTTQDDTVKNEKADDEKMEAMESLTDLDQ